MKNPAVLMAALACLAMVAPGCARKAEVPEPLVATASAPGAILFEDDFRGARRWREDPGPPCRVEYSKEGLVIRNTGDSGTCEENFRSAGEFPARVRIEAAVRKVEGPGDQDFGLKFGFSGEPGGSYYTFTVKEDGTTGLAWYGGSWKMLLPWELTPSESTRPEGSVRFLAVEIRGRRITAFLDGRMVGDVTGPRDAAGYVGFYLNSPGLAVAFSGLRIALIP